MLGVRGYVSRVLEAMFTRRLGLHNGIILVSLRLRFFGDRVCIFYILLKCLSSGLGFLGEQEYIFWPLVLY